MATIQERIQALNLGQVGRSPHQPAQPSISSRRPTPPTHLVRSYSAQGQHATTSQAGVDVGNQPASHQDLPAAPVRVEKAKRPPPPPPRPPKESQTFLPSDESRRNSYVRAIPPPRPALPPRNSSQALTRRTSQESIASTVSTTPSLVSNISTPQTSLASSSVRSDSVDGRSPAVPARSVKAPAFDASSLPKLPPRKTGPVVHQGATSTVSAKPSFSNFSLTPRNENTARAPQPAAAPNNKTASAAIDAAGKRASIKSPPPGRWSVRHDQREQPIPPEPSRADLEVEQPRPEVQQPVVPVRSQEAPAAVQSTPKRSALSWGMNRSTEQTPTVPTRPHPNSVHGDAPPPVPTASRPNLAALQASKPKPSATGKPYTPSPDPNTCLKCRDFSAPDNHAARFPRESIPSHDIAWLAKQLTDPFPSLTDKARALFTWQHHNITYNVEAFFSGNIERSTPNSTIATGLAVCEGYAALFANMAVHAGLEAVVIGGHGAGFGFTPIGPGEACPPPDPNGHAWNAVKIDGGQWKLIDVCWGSGHLNDQRTYTKFFHPECFTMSNEEFGLKHFPQNREHFFREDGRVLSWEEYYLGPDGHGEKVQVYSCSLGQHGFDGNAFLPKMKHIYTRGVSPKTRVQFQMQTVCEHWDPVRHGKGRPYTFVLQVGGKDGRKKDMIPYQTDGRRFWWVDVAMEDLGCAGQSIFCYAITTINGKDGRGITAREFLDAKGKSSMSWSGVASWQLV